MQNDYRLSSPTLTLSSCNELKLSILSSLSEKCLNTENLNPIILYVNVGLNEKKKVTVFQYVCR